MADGSFGICAGTQGLLQGVCSIFSFVCASNEPGSWKTHIVKVKSVLKEESWKFYTSITRETDVDFPIQVVPIELFLFISQLQMCEDGVWGSVSLYLAHV